MIFHSRLRFQTADVFFFLLRNRNVPVESIVAFFWLAMLILHSTESQCCRMYNKVGEISKA